MSAGDMSTCAIRTNGKLACWGYIGTRVPKGRFTAVSTSQSTSCAIRRDGRLVCWFAGDTELGVRWALEPTPAGRFTAVSATGSIPCAIRTDGTLACWGEEDVDPLLKVPPGSYTDISFPCAIRVDGALVCLWNPENWGGASPRRGRSPP